MSKYIASVGVAVSALCLLAFIKADQFSKPPIAAASGFILAATGFSLGWAWGTAASSRKRTIYIHKLTRDPIDDSILGAVDDLLSKKDL